MQTPSSYVPPADSRPRTPQHDSIASPTSHVSSPCSIASPVSVAASEAKSPDVDDADADADAASVASTIRSLHVSAASAAARSGERLITADDARAYLLADTRVRDAERAYEDAKELHAKQHNRLLMLMTAARRETLDLTEFISNPDELRQMGGPGTVRLLRGRPRARPVKRKTPEMEPAAPRTAGAAATATAKPVFPKLTADDVMFAVTQGLIDTTKLSADRIAMRIDYWVRRYHHIPLDAELPPEKQSPHHQKSHVPSYHLRREFKSSSSSSSSSTPSAASPASPAPPSPIPPPDASKMDPGRSLASLCTAIVPYVLPIKRPRVDASDSSASSSPASSVVASAADQHDSNSDGDHHHHRSPSVQPRLATAPASPPLPPANEYGSMSHDFQTQLRLQPHVQS